MEAASASHPCPWSDLVLSPSRCRCQQVRLHLVDRGPEPCGARPGAAGSWLCLESSADKCCTPQIGLLSARPCGSAGV